MTFSSRTIRSLGFCAASFLFCTSFQPVLAYDASASDNLVLYWGQNSYGATNTNTANFQKNLSYYCTSDSVTDAFPIAFLTAIDAEGGLPSIDLANVCNDNDDATFSGTELPNCQFMASDIQTCQAAGKIVTLSIGGATGGVTLASDSAAEAFADVIWDVFLGGSSDTRPFGDAILDGVDLDIEGGGTAFYSTFVTRLRTYADSADKPYYVTAAPQCPFPDANLDTVINAVGFDAIYVQFYNNFCGLTNFDNSNDWNFNQWDDWAKNTSPNPDVKIFIGAPASSTAASSGYVDAETLASIIQTTKSTYSSFGGVMMWDASQAYANDRYDISAKNALTGGDTAIPSSSSSSATTSNTVTPVSSTTTSAVTTTSTVSAAGGCSGVSAWSSSVAYVGGSEVTYNGHLWSAQWWTEADTPGGSAGVWVDDGACTTSAHASILPEVLSSSALASLSSSETFVSSLVSTSNLAITTSTIGSPSESNDASNDGTSTALQNGLQQPSASAKMRRALRFERENYV